MPDNTDAPKSAIDVMIEDTQKRIEQIRAIVYTKEDEKQAQAIAIARRERIVADLQKQKN